MVRSQTLIKNRIQPNYYPFYFTFIYRLYIVSPYAKEIKAITKTISTIGFETIL